MIKDNNMFVYGSIHEIASPYQSKRHIKYYIVVCKLQNEPLSQNLVYNALQDFHKDTGREERMDNKILVGKKINHATNTVNSCSNFT